MRSSASLRSTPSPIPRSAVACTHGSASHPSRVHARRTRMAGYSAMSLRAMRASPSQLYSMAMVMTGERWHTLFRRLYRPTSLRRPTSSPTRRGRSCVHSRRRSTTSYPASTASRRSAVVRRPPAPSSSAVCFTSPTSAIRAQCLATARRLKAARTTATVRPPTSRPRTTPMLRLRGCVRARLAPTTSPMRRVSALESRQVAGECAHSRCVGSSVAPRACGSSTSGALGSPCHARSATRRPPRWASRLSQRFPLCRSTRTASSSCSRLMACGTSCPTKRLCAWWRAPREGARLRRPARSLSAQRSLGWRACGAKTT
mmetsp:Transcript_6885/g.17610  ORF Transcript_6885/g.17610 Transcript_6885/m.17610 type:complete len:316 (+) Transcript_6885:285-1232(+)